jgi:hypothetical protein
LKFEKKLSRFNIILINIIVLILILSLIEGGFRVAEVRSSKYVNHKEFRSSRPEPYNKSSYFTKDFISESWFQPGGWKTPDGTNLIIPNDFHGKFFNIKNGLRSTYNTPSKYINTIYLFGGSTIYNSEVPDEHTVASYLQSLVNENGFKYKVENYGTTSVHVNQQLERLKRDVKIKKNDVVIFYDGVNDVVQKIWLDKPAGVLSNQQKEAPKFIFAIRWIAKYSAFFRWYDQRFLTLKSYPIDIKKIHAVANNYVSTLVYASEYVNSNGAIFKHFLQPNLYTKNPHNLYELEMMNWGNEMSPVGAQAIFEGAYPIFANKLTNISFSMNLTSIFNDLKVSPYVDFCHVTEVGNKKIAESIFGVLKNNLSK